MLCSVGTVLGPTLTEGMMARGPVVSQMLFSQGHQRRFSEVRSWDCIQRGAGATVVLWGSSGSAEQTAFAKAVKWADGGLAIFH